MAIVRAGKSLMRKKPVRKLGTIAAAFQSLSLLVLLSPVPPAWSDSGGELFLFPHLDAFYRTGQDSSLGSTDQDLAPGIDFFATYHHENIQLLAEYFLNEDESELERALIGWRINETRFWFGRFHNPLGRWNTQFHHGVYLQTSFSRPGLVEFEDDGGIFPIHVTGLLVGGVRTLGDRGIVYDIAVGFGPGFKNAEGILEPLNLLDPSDGEQELTATVRLGYQPDAFRPNEVGFFASLSTFPGDAGPIEEIKQRILGTYVDWNIQRWHFTGELYYVRSDVRQSLTEATSSFVDGYLQAEYSFNPDWTMYGRIEDNSTGVNDPYLALFPSHIAERQLVGLTYRIGERHVLKAEIANVSSLQDRFGEFALQWSMVLP